MLDASSSLGSTNLIATRAYQSNLKPAQRARKARTTPGSLHAKTAGVVIRVWTLCIIRSPTEQRQTARAALPGAIHIGTMRPDGPSFALRTQPIIWGPFRGHSGPLHPTTASAQRVQVLNQIVNVDLP